MSIKTLKRVGMAFALAVAVSSFVASVIAFIITFPKAAFYTYVVLVFSFLVGIAYMFLEAREGA